MSNEKYESGLPEAGEGEQQPFDTRTRRRHRFVLEASLDPRLLSAAT